MPHPFRKLEEEAEATAVILAGFAFAIGGLLAVVTHTIG